MTETAESKKSLIEEFKGLTPKQWIAIIGTFAVCTAMVATGIFLMMCMGFFLVAVVLYMVPHLLGVSSPKVKGIVGALFIVTLLLIAAFAYSGSAVDSESSLSKNTVLKEADIVYDANYKGTITIYSDNPELDIKVSFAPVTGIQFGKPAMYDKSNVTEPKLTYADGKFTGTLDLEKGKYYFIETVVNLNTEGEPTEYWQVFKNTGISSSDVNMLSLSGSWLTIVEIAAIFFIMLIFSELMRRSAKKKRDQLVAEGRLYPEGYDKCKKCGTMVLPGEITCRKCGTPIEVPEDVKVLHKKDFFECSECGTEVPLDAKFCPKCGAPFDEATETEITHVDGTVDVSTDTFECSECGKEVPANATRCPYCGVVFDEEDE